MAYYYESPLSDSEMGCYSYNGIGSSHENIIESANGHIDTTIRDPRPGKDGVLTATRVWIYDDNKNRQIVGMDFEDKHGDYACSYKGTSYDDILSQAHDDLREKRANVIRENYNMRAGTERTRIPGSMYMDDRKLKREFYTEIKEVKKMDRPELYEKFNGIKNPNTGNVMECTSVYVGAKGIVNSEEEVKYIELYDKQANERFHYTASPSKDIDKQVSEDYAKLQNQNRNNVNMQDIGLNGVSKSNELSGQNNSGGIKRS